MAGKETYLGDAVYASFDGYKIWIRTDEGNGIFLQPAVFKALVEYEEQIRVNQQFNIVHNL